MPERFTPTGQPLPGSSREGVSPSVSITEARRQRHEMWLKRTKAAEVVTVSTDEGERQALAIPLTQGKVALISPEDAYVTGYTWMYKPADGHNNPQETVCRTIPTEGRRKKVLLHRAIIEGILDRPLRNNETIAHNNGNGLDNRRENLSLLTKSEGLHRSKLNRNNNSGYKGVFFNKKYGRWKAQIAVQGKRMMLGWFSSPREAAKAYNEAAVTYYGDVAKLNDLAGEEDEIKG